MLKTAIITIKPAEVNRIIPVNISSPLIPSESTSMISPYHNHNEPLRPPRVLRFKNVSRNMAEKSIDQ